MRTTLTVHEQQELTRLLRHVAEKDLGFLPDTAYRAFHPLVPWPAVEVLIHDDSGRFILTYRDDDFHGWHIPGGFMRVNESLPAACNRHVRKERVATAVTNIRHIATHVWLEGEHPFGYPISLILACEAVGKVSARKDLKWFRRIPSAVIPQQHPRFLAFFQKWLKGARTAATIL